MFYEIHTKYKNTTRKRHNKKKPPKKKQVLIALRAVQVFFVSGYIFFEIHTANITKHANIPKSQITKK